MLTWFNDIWIHVLLSYGEKGNHFKEQIQNKSNIKKLYHISDKPPSLRVLYPVPPHCTGCGQAGHSNNIWNEDDTVFYIVAIQ